MNGNFASENVHGCTGGPTQHHSGDNNGDDNQYTPVGSGCGVYFSTDTVIPPRLVQSQEVPMQEGASHRQSFFLSLIGMVTDVCSKFFRWLKDRKSWTICILFVMGSMFTAYYTIILATNLGKGLVEGNPKMGNADSLGKVTLMSFKEHQQKAYQDYLTNKLVSKCVPIIYVFCGAYVIVVGRPM